MNELLGFSFCCLFDLIAHDSLMTIMPCTCTMHAGDYRLEEIATPVAGDEEVIVKVRAVGICASDAKCYEGAPLFWGRTAHHV